MNSPPDIGHLTPAERRLLAQRLAELHPASGREMLVAHLTLVPLQSAPNPQELREYLAGFLQPHKIPAVFRQVESMPLTSSGKIDRGALDSMSPAEAAPAPQQPAPAEVSPLLAIWREILGNPNLGPHDDFFEAGGDSILSIQLVSQARDAGIDLSVSQIFKTPTVAAIEGETFKTPTVAAIQDETVRPPIDLSGAKCLIPLQPSGSRPPIFCIHAGDGHVAFYRSLPEHLGNSVPFYALQPVGSDGRERPLQTMEEMASRYIQEIKLVQPEGPYYLVGFCFGATAAFEVAQQLRREGHEIPLLVLIDASAPTLTPYVPDPVAASPLMQKFPALYSLFMLKKRITRRLTLQIQKIRGSAPGRDELNRDRIRYFCRRAFLTYLPDSYDGKCHFVQGSDSADWDREHWEDGLVEDWEKITSDLEVAQMDCKHGEFLAEPHAQVLARLILERLSDLAARPSPDGKA